MCIPLTLTLSNKDFVPLGDSERDVGSLAIDETDIGKDIMSFVAKLWGLEQYFEPFIPPNDAEMLFQFKLLDGLKIYIISSIFLNLVASWSNKKIKFLATVIWFNVIITFRWLMSCSFYMV